MSANDFDQLANTLATEGVDAALEQLVERLRATKNYRDLFAARQMQVRHRLGLPAIDSGALRDLEGPTRTQLEDGYIAACREVGGLLLGDGRLREAWPYLNIVGDRHVVRTAMETLPVTDENINDAIEIALYEGVWPQRGVQWILQSRGTCNTITTLDGVMHALSPADQSAAVGILVRHLHGELVANVRSDIARQEGSAPEETTLAGLVADRDWLFSNENYHIDTTHLSSTVRFARQLTAADELGLAIDLTEYGRRLSRPFQFEAEEPFKDFYPSHALYLRALLARDRQAADGNDDIDAAAAYFQRRAQEANVDECGTTPTEIYIALLARVGRYDEAIEATVQLLPQSGPTVGLAPSVLELAARGGHYGRLMQICRDRGDLVGFVAGLVESKGVEDRR